MRISAQYPLLPPPHQQSSTGLEHPQLDVFAPGYIFKKHNSGLGVQGAPPPPLPPVVTQTTLRLHGYAPSGHGQEQQPASSPSFKSMPSTPKSATYHISAPPDSSGKHSTEAAEEADVDVEVDTDGQQFVLAPTPAQLGRAPLQRRKNLCKS